MCCAYHCLVESVNAIVLAADTHKLFTIFYNHYP